MRVCLCFNMCVHTYKSVAEYVCVVCGGFAPKAVSCKFTTNLWFQGAVNFSARRLNCVYLLWLLCCWLYYIVTFFRFVFYSCCMIPLLLFYYKNVSLILRSRLFFFFTTTYIVIWGIWGWVPLTQHARLKSPTDL